MKLEGAINTRQLQCGGPGSGRKPGFASSFHQEVHGKFGVLKTKLEKQGWPSHAKAFGKIQQDLANGKDFSQEHEDAMQNASSAISGSENATKADRALADKIDDLGVHIIEGLSEHGLEEGGRPPR